jgi:hypothetical protein
MKNTISKFQEKEIKNIENINGGKGKKGEVRICFIISGVFDGIPKNTDWNPCKVSRWPRRSRTMSRTRTMSRGAW